MEQDYLPEVGTNGWNDSPAWVGFISRYDDMRRAIARKYAGRTDESFIEDAMQAAFISLMTVWPERVEGFEEFSQGKISTETWNKRLDKYCRQVIRNSILSFLKSPSTGPLYYGRYRTKIDPMTGEKKKVRRNATFLSLDEMLSSGKYQVDSFGNMISGDIEDDTEYLYHNNE